MIEAARSKLEQTRYFLELLSDDLKRPGHGEPEAPKYLMSAILHSAKATHERLRKHNYGAAGAFAAVQRRWQAERTREDQEFFRHMLGLRDEDVHTRDVDRSREALIDAESIPGTKVWGSPHARFQITDVHGRRRWVRAAAVFRSYYLEHAGEQIPVLKACRRFIALLTSLVEAAERSGRDRGLS